MSTDLPIVIEVVDDVAHTDRLVEILDEMLDGGMVTIEKCACSAMRPASGSAGIVTSAALTRHQRAQPAW
jgi:hypothetical protein